MESITIFLRDFSYFNAGALVGAACMLLLAAIAFAGPLYWQQQDINRLEEDKKAAMNEIDVFEGKNNELKKEFDAEKERCHNLEVANEQLEERYNKIYVECDS